MNKSLFKHLRAHRVANKLCLGTVKFISASFMLFSVSAHCITDIAPEAASAINPINTLTTKKFITVTANPHATAAATDILQKGGSAVDAAIAAQLVLGLVEPQSSGIGGGAFMLHWDASDTQLISYDGRETAPKAVDENHFLLDSGKPMPFFDAVIGGRGVGVPGVIAMLELAHKVHGKLPWHSLFVPAIELADDGFTISPRLHKLLQGAKRMSKGLHHQAFRDYFYDDKELAKAVGSVLKNPDYANTLRLLASKGGQAFYTGKLAKDMVNAVSTKTLRPGKLALSDLENYRPKTRSALCGPFYQYRVCGMGPPSSGGFTVLSLLGILEQRKIGPTTSSVDFIHLFSESSKLAFADRNTYIADPDFVRAPLADLLSADYLKGRAALINDKRSMEKALPGSISGAKTSQWKASQSPAQPSTSHLSIVDRWGNIVSMTSSIEMAFGSRILVGGFLLNNQLTDFSFVPTREDTGAIANRIEAQKRPRSSMSPTIVFDREDQPVLVIGSPGGSRIINYVARVLAQNLAMDLSLDDAIKHANIVDLNKHLELEADTGQEQYLKALQARGHEVKLKSQTSGLHGIRINKRTLFGVADPRREGSVAGQ